MPGFRVVLIGFVALVALAQQPQPQQTAPPPAEQAPATFRTSVDVVVAPVVVRDRDGGYVNGLQPTDFRLFDNGKEQNIKVDVAYQPISMVIAVQANGHVDSVLPKIQKVGSLIQPILIGDQGEAAVLAFDHRQQILQEFTSDSTKISDALKKIRAGSSTSTMIDAVNKAVFMLRSRPANRRRVVLLISETRDYGSEGRAREALIAAQLANVSIFSVDISRFFTTLTAKPEPPRQSQLPPAAMPLPAGVPRTPTSVQQTYGLNGGTAQFIPLMVELFKDAKAIFKDNPVELFTKGTGGSEYGFTRQRGLEDAISRISEELHSQYLISYTPNNKDEGGFHEITVDVVPRRDIGSVKVHTRPGYWLAAKFE
jgi:VWFA-related protein